MNNNKVLANSFLWLFIGLLICFGVSYVSTLDVNIFLKIYTGFHGYAYLIFFITELIIAFSFNFLIRKLSPIAAKLLYLAYSGITGLSLTGIFFIYTGTSLAFIFLVTALLFGIFALIGYVTKIDLSKFGIYLFIALISIILLEIINIFLMNKTLDMTLSIITIIVFLGYIAYDVKNATNEDFLCDTENKGIFIAFQLFIDFINIFIELLRLFGKSKD